LLKAGKFVAHAALFDDASSGDSKDRDFLDLDAPPGQLNASEYSLMRSCRDIAARNPVSRTKNVEHAPVGKCGP